MCADSALCFSEWPKVLSKKTMSLSMDLGTPTMDKGLGAARARSKPAARSRFSRLQTCPSCAPLGTASSLQPAFVGPVGPVSCQEPVLSTIAADGKEPQGHRRQATALESALARAAAC